MATKNRNINKSLIFIKATVIALGIVLIVSIPALFILKNKQKSSEINCPDLTIKISGKIAEFKTEENSVIILTTVDGSQKQEVIKIDNYNCPKIINRFTIENAK